MTSVVVAANCNTRTLFNDLVAGKVDIANDLCSQQLTVAPDPYGYFTHTVFANDLNITSVKITKLDDSVQAVWLSDNKFTSFPVFNVKPATFLGLASNQIQQLVNLTLPDHLTWLELHYNKITTIYGVSFPSKLNKLFIDGNPITTFEVAQRDANLFASMGITFKADVTQDSCQNVKATLKPIGTANLCVLPDDDWDALYRPATKASATPTPTTASSSRRDPTSASKSSEQRRVPPRSSSSAIGIIVGALVAVGVLILGFAMWKKRRRHDHHDNAAIAELGNEDLTGDDQPYCKAATQATLDPSTCPSSRTTNSPGSKLDQTALEALLLNDPDILAIRIPLQKLQQLERIGIGAHAEVFRGVVDGKAVAIKRLSEEVMTCGGGPLSLITEVRMLVPLKHPNLVSLIGVAWQPHTLTTLRVVYEFMNRGDLRQWLVNFQQTGHPRGFDKGKLGIALDVAHGLKYLHSQKPKVIHRDLKSRNILLNDRLQAKVTDFGISRYASEETLTKTAGVGTNLWMAPEVLVGDQYDEKADIFSFGVVLSELDTHLVPYADATAAHEREIGRRMPEYAILQNVTSGVFQVGFTHKASQDPVVALGLACVALDPKKRPSALEVWCELDTIVHSL